MRIASCDQTRATSYTSQARQAPRQEESANVPQDGFSPSQCQPQPPAQRPAPQPPATEPTPPQPQPPAQPELKEWTVLVFSQSDNNLYQFLQADLDELEKVGSTDEMNVVAQTSHQPRGGSVVRMKLETDATPGLKSPVLEDLGKTHDTATKESLRDAIIWAQTNYPSKHTMVVVSDHGAGWKGCNHAESTDSWVDATELEGAFAEAAAATGKKVDVIGFDQCLMASTEIAHQLKDVASYMVGSEEVEGGAGWQYDEAFGEKKTNTNSRVLTPKMLNYAAAALRARDPLTPADMATAIVTMAEGHQRDLGTMSAIDLSKMPAVTDAVNNFAGKVLESNLGKLEFTPVYVKTQKFSDFGDMGHFVELAGKQFGGAIGEAADQVKAALGEAVIAEQHSSKYPNAKGLNIELNKKAASVESTAFGPDAVPGDIPNMDREDRDRLSFSPYSATKWAQDTQWDEMLRKVR
jgi:hypothetical protein